MENYKANDLLKLAFEVAIKSASDPKKVTATHLLYACAYILTMPRGELIAQVGGDEDRNTRVLGALAEAEKNFKEKPENDSEFVSIPALKNLTFGYLKLLESSDIIKNLHDDYELVWKCIGRVYLDYKALYFKEAADLKTFSQIPQLIFSIHGATGYIENCEKEGHALPDDEVEAISGCVLRNTGLFREQVNMHGIQMTAHATEKESAQSINSRMEELQKRLYQTICGQDQAVRNFLSGLKKAYFFQSRKNKPLAVFLLAGPPGVGKTYLAETAAAALGLPYRRFDMSEYGGTSSDNVQGFVGFERTWKNATPGVLTSYVEGNPNALILFDEIEKASPQILKLFLGIFEGARLTDKYTERTVSFEGNILLFTTNAGKELYEDNYDMNLSALSGDTVAEALRDDKQFPNELVSRFAAGNIIMFNHINKMNLMDIAKRAMKRTFADSGFTYRLEDADRVEERLVHLLMLHEGNRLDARITASKAEGMVAQILLEYMEEKGDVGDREKPVTVALDSDGSAGAAYLFPDEKEPVRILYITNTEWFEVGVSDIDDDQDFFDKDLSWVDLRVCRTFHPELLREPENRYQMIVIDLIADDWSSGLEKEKEISGGLSGKELLAEILRHPGGNHIYVADDGALREEEKRYLLLQGVEGFLPCCPNKEDWFKLATRHYVIRSMEQLEMDGKALDYRIRAFPERHMIKLMDFTLKEVVVEKAEIRRKDQETLVSDWQRPRERFDDIIGAENAKRELKQFINYVKKPEYYEMMGLGIPRGVLLYGPPGTGKTMLARAAAGESGVSFIAVSASDFEQRYAGVGEQKIRELFATARRNSPAIIFIDEIDTIGKQRLGGEAAQHTEKLLNTLLTEMDGFSSLKKKQVFVMAATNFDIDGTKSGKRVSIDDALARRFPVQIYVDLPNRDERIRYVEKYLQKKAKKAGIIDTDRNNIKEMAQAIADQTVGQSLAIVENILDYAMRRFIMGMDEEPQKHSDSGKLTVELLLEYVQEMRFGEKTGTVKTSTAYHEAAHAFAAWKVGETPAFLTIVSRDDFGGYMQRKESERGTHTEQSLRNLIRIALAGRAGEMVYYKYYAEGAGSAELLKEAVNTGAGSDFEHATFYAKQIVTNLGRSNDSLARIPENLWSAEMKREVLEEVNLLLRVEMERTQRMVEESRELVHRLALEAIDKTQLTERQILSVLEHGMI